jgi:ABC-type uncharacterized transport system substrate-binding protein
MAYLGRRTFITLLGGAAGWPLAAQAQQHERMPVIGFLHSASPDGNPTRVRAFREGLRETGFIEGENVAIEYRWAENQFDRLPALADELVRRRVAVLVAPAGPPVAFAAKAATKTIPIVFVVAEDPVKLGLVASVNRPDGNLTGINFLNVELAAIRLGLLRELLPGAVRIALVAARAQQTAPPTIGFLGPSSAVGHASHVEGLRQGLSATGFVEGANAAVEYRFADNQLDRLPALAAELVARRVAVIATGGATAAALAAKAATSSIPIVFAIGADPVKFGLVASMNRPGGNVTGVSFLANTLVAKQLQLLRGLLPAAGVIGAIVNPGNPNAVSDSAQAQAAATSLRLKLHVVHTVAEREFDAAFEDIGRAQASAVLFSLMRCSWAGADGWSSSPRATSCRCSTPSAPSSRPAD